MHNNSLLSFQRLLECFHTRAKCTIRMIIRVTVILMTVFWPMCTQISITKGNLNCAIQMMRRCFPVTHLSNHAAKSPYECLDLKIVIWGGGGGQSYVTFEQLPPINHTSSNRNSISNEIANSMSEEHRNKPGFFSPLWNAKAQTRRRLLSLSCVHSVIQISQLQFQICCRVNTV